MKQYMIYEYRKSPKIFDWLTDRLGKNGGRWEFTEEYYTHNESHTIMVGWYKAVFTFFDDSDYMEFMLCRPIELH